MAFNRDLSQLANFLEINSEGTFVNIIPSSSETNLGIGTNNPTAKLDVLGNARVSGNLSATNINASGIVTATSGFVGPLTGLASSATQLATGRTVAITGDIAYTSGVFDGTSNVTGVGTLANTAVTPGSYGSSTQIPTFTVDSKGRLTAAGTASVGTALTVAGDSGSENVDLLTETLTISGGTNLTSSAASNTVTVNLDDNISLTSVVASGVVTATSGFSGNLTGEVNAPSFDTNASGVVVTGITTSSDGFVGALTGNVSGNVTGNINSSGVSTVTSLNATNINASGIVTATSGFVGNLTGTASTTTNIPNLTGDITSVNTATTLATVNSNVGSFGSQTLIPVVTVNAKGLVTSVTTAAVGTALTVSGDSGSENVDLLTETLTISGGTNLTSSAASNTVTVNLDPNISLTSVVASGVITATSGFSGNVTGNLTGDINSSGVSTVTSLNATNINTSGIVTAAQFVTGASGSAIGINTNTISGPATITIDPAAVGNNTGLVVIKGDLQIDGTTTTINSTTVTVDDKNIQIADGAANDAAADGAGITITSGDGNKTFQFQDSGDNLGSSENLNVASGKVYKINNTEVLSSTTLGSGVVNSSLTSVGTLTNLSVGNVNSSGIITATTFVGALTGNVTGDINSSGVSTVTSLNATNINASGIVTATSGFVGNLTGLASSATQLQTSRDFSISGDATASSISFDGTANVGLALTLANTAVTPGSYGSSTQIPTFTVDSKGRLTAAGTASVGTALTVSGDSGSENIDLLSETLTISGGTNLTSSAASNTVTVNLDPNISLTSVVASGVITATSGFSGNLTGDINSSGVSTVTSLIATNINTSGIVTAAQFVTGASGSAIGINTNTISGPETITIDPAAVGGNTGLVVIKGDLQIDGTTTTINSTTVTVDDKNIQIADGAVNDAAADGAGITITSGDGNKTFQFQDNGDNLGSSENLNVASGKVYKVNNTEVLSSTTLGSGVVNSSLTSVGTLTNLSVGNVNSSGIITATTFVGALTGNVTGDINSSGVSTVTSLNATNINASGIVTATSGFVGNLTGTASTTTNIPNLTGDITSNNLATTLATVNSNVGSFGSQTLIPVVTVNAKGLVTAVTTAAVGTALTVSGDSGSENIDLLTETLTISGGTNLTSSSASNTVTVNLDDNISLVSVNASGVITATSGFSGNLTGNVTGNVTGNINSSGVSTVTNLNIDGYVSVGNTTGVANQLLASVGAGVTWKTINDLLPQTRTTQTFTATAGQTLFNFVYNVNFLDVFVNGVKLSSGEFTASNGTTITLSEAAFANDTVEFVSYSTLGAGTGQVSSLNDLTDVTLSGIATGNLLAYNGSEFVNTSTLSNITALDAITTATIESAVGAAPNNFTSLNISGISTLNGLVDINNDVDISGNLKVVGISTLNNVVVGGATTALVVNGDARITGILTIGTSTLTLDGSNNQVNVGSATTINTTGFTIGNSFLHSTGLSLGSGNITSHNINSTGIITATSFVGDGSGLTGAGSTVFINNATNQEFFPLFTSTTSGTITASGISTSKLKFNPSSGTVTATEFAGALTGTATSTTNIPNLTGAITSNNTTTSLGSFTSAQLATALTDETGSGSAVFATSPTLVTPVLGTPSSGTLTNCTSLPISGLTASTSTALGVGSIELGHATDTTISRVSAGVVAIEGVNIVTTSSTDTLTNKTLTSPTLTTPVLGTPSSGTLTSCTGLPLTTGVTGTLPVANGGTGVTASTGTGSVVLSASPTFTGTVGAAAITATGDIAAANFNSTSDINLKENIRQVESASELVSKLEGVHFSWKETGKETIGVIAQQIEEHLPQLVQTGDTHKTVNYNGLIGVLIEAVKEQGAQIAALQAEIEELKK